MSFFSEHRTVKELLQEKRDVVFYAESRHYYQYFKHLVNALLEKNIPVCYITSDKNDPLLLQGVEGLEVAYIKWQLGFLFLHMKASVVVMTMPDLDNFLFKRSPFVEDYVYVFHAAVSTHQQYSLRAFFNYNTIFCTGDYQEREIRKAEDLYGQKGKTIVHYGYPLFDEIQKKHLEFKRSAGEQKRILIAPSWFEGCIFDTCIEELLEQLSKLPYEIVLRSHPEYEKRRRKAFNRLKKMIKNKPSVSIDNIHGVTDSLVSADILITDRSGIAFEFAFGTKRPVLFIDTAMKQSNMEWSKMEIEPIENSIREKIGIPVHPRQLNQLEVKINEMVSRKTEFKNQIEELKEKFFYNSGDSYSSGPDYIVSKILNR